jgi:tetrahydromethanopterin S-methyltransferase subunit B
VKEQEAKPIADAITALAGQITSWGTFPGTDETGGSVHSLTEAVMGVTAGLCRIADALESVATAIREREAE